MAWNAINYYQQVIKRTKVKIITCVMIAKVRQLRKVYKSAFSSL